LDKNRPYDQVLAEFVDGEEVASYVYGLDLISQERNGEDWFYFVDGLGSTRGLTDSSGEVTDAYWYDAYGNLVDRVGSSENDYLFAGEQFDEALGQYYLRQRYYDATTGRFTRRDTYEGRLEEPVTLHKYLYANGNPVSYVDPSGLYATTLGAYFAIEAVLLAIAIIGIGVAAYYDTNYEPERLRGFGEGPGINIRELESPRPRDPEESLLGRILTFPREQLRVPDHTGHPRDNSLDNFIRHVFSSENLNPEEVRAALEDSPLKTYQQSVSLPRVARYVQTMKQGVNMGSIKVDDDIIVDGHHRYIASKILGIEIDVQNWTASSAGRQAKPISEIDLSSVDF